MVRAPLRAEVLREQLVDQNRWAALDVVDRTGSTNSDLAEAARAGAADRTVLIAEEQTAGRGRQQRSWTSPRGAGLYVSVLWRPRGVPAPRLAWLPLLTGLVLAEVIDELTGIEAAVKWPNDLLVGPARAKCAGVLAEVVSVQPEPAVVVGVGLNVSHRRDELATGPGGLTATSLAVEGMTSVSREQVAVAFLRHLATAEAQWRQAAGDPVASGLQTAFRQVCATVGQQVRVELPNGGALHGTAVDVDADGRLVIREASGALVPVSAGDVVHVRPVG
ncbi:BirA family transcriptional regulator, biotin operon repressor / biotin-[acetyl-CoA-carboxylase] ligase [Streptoalloteichus tenebrarius]|uniref:biotin--[biotin carboxyl-carrier protein] ligase n=1 Tax=Streptoalloteichus tenebrarius (strain ATCC 17920 / DSM 40477 / JCM 4838 / CBS 697.72 / NBRC 16177 / NCIMB 11028 / NRRL B-12390 / A12253. 1 / ISP 5477) TaxID=1933 RepID=A0ABT1HY36_STRSD|nr:BirA family transcriptional regulator, biotin operon repressor / biotin-[acetyl-CoA-carboxylase] ligase [Streptoalloteichus tenebrarius]